MLDGFLGRGFASKCKSSIKLTRTRIDAIRRKRSATQKFLKKDIADLLVNGLEINAYGRAEGLLLEQRLSSCYDFIEQSCECILEHLLVLQKQSECPEECRVAVSSLMFAAARFSDLPELRDLRQMFQERYGDSLEYFVNQELVENLASKPPTLEKKVNLLQDIASEFSIEWDSKAFERRMSKPPTSALDQTKTHRYFFADDKHNLLNGTDNTHKLPLGEDAVPITAQEYKPPNGKEAMPKTGKEYKLPIGKEAAPKTDNDDALAKERHRLTNGRNYDAYERDEMIERQKLPLHKHKPSKSRDSTLHETENHDISFQGRREYSDVQHESNVKEEEIAPKTVRLGSSSHGLPVKNDRTEISFTGNNQDGQHCTVNSIREVEEEERERIKKPHYNNALPPPYHKSKHSKHGVSVRTKNASFDCNGAPLDPSVYFRADAGATPEGIQIGSDLHGHEEHYYQEDITASPVPRRRSSRRRHLRSQSSHDDRVNLEDTGVARKSSSSRRRDRSRRGLQVLIEDEHHQKDEEERMIDKLLLHYSKKPSAYEPEKVKQKLGASPSHRNSLDVAELKHRRSRDEPEVKSEKVSTPVRSSSLPREQAPPLEAAKTFTRASSLQPNMLSPARHVHPKLPDYDDLAARFAAMKAK